MIAQHINRRRRCAEDEAVPSRRTSHSNDPIPVLVRTGLPGPQAPLPGDLARCRADPPRGSVPCRAASSSRALTFGIIPRKEVIQPQLPLRLPCYDFVPITSPTLDSCPSCELAHRLQVLPAFMT